MIRTLMFRNANFIPFSCFLRIQWVQISRQVLMQHWKATFLKGKKNKSKGRVVLDFLYCLLPSLFSHTLMRGEENTEMCAGKSLTNTIYRTQNKVGQASILFGDTYLLSWTRGTAITDFLSLPSPL